MQFSVPKITNLQVVALPTSSAGIFGPELLPGFAEGSMVFSVYPSNQKVYIGRWGYFRAFYKTGSEVILVGRLFVNFGSVSRNRDCWGR